MKINVLHMRKQRCRSAISFAVSPKLISYRKTDQPLCFRYLDSKIPLLPSYSTSFIRNFKPLAISSGCTAWFVSDLVRIHNVGFPTLQLISFSLEAPRLWLLLAKIQASYKCHLKKNVGQANLPYSVSF